MEGQIYYRHSGKFAPWAPIVLFPAAFIGIFILSMIYGYIQRYNPFIYVSFLATIGYAFAVGIIIAFLGKMCRVRNTPLMFLIGVFLAFVTEYFDWACWLFIITKYDPVAFHPFAVIGSMIEFSKEGTFTMKGSTPTGIMLWLLWAIEALAVMGIVFYIPGKMTTDDVFCEALGRWTSEKETVSLLEPILQPKEFKMSLEQRNYTSLLRLRKMKFGAFHYTEIDVDYCAGHDGLFVLSVKDITVTTDKEGKEQKKEKILVKHMYIDKQSFERVKALKKNTMDGESPMELPPGAITPPPSME